MTAKQRYFLLFCTLFYEAIYSMKWYDECSVMSWKIFKVKQPWSNQGIILYLPGGTEENHETLNQDSWYPD
jgi:hypothetical protein